MALLLYEKQLRLQKDVPASGGDPTWFDNRLVWAKFLDKSFVQSAFPGRVAPFIVLPEFLRVWMAILDGECQVERDLGFMRGFTKATKGRASDKLLENLLILKLNGPKTGEEVQGRFAVQCVELWRKIHLKANQCPKRRRRPRQPAAPRQKPRRGTFADAKRCVLRASRLAKIQRPDNARTAYGVSADFFKKPCGEVKENCAEWGAALQKFSTLTKAYSIRNRMLGQFARAVFPKFKLRQSTNQRIPPDYSGVRLLVYVPTYNSAACGALAAGYEIRAGHNACRTAHVVIVDDLTRLHSDHADLDWVLHLLYIVARGLPVTTAACASSVNGDVKKMPRTSFREHRPQMTRRVNFLIAKQLNAEHPALASALRAIEQMPSSAWRVKLTNDIESASAAAASSAPRAVSASSAASGAVGKKKTPTVRRPSVVAKGGRPAGAVKVEDVNVPDLATMLAWLQRNRRTENANYTRMCWRRDLPGAI